MYECVWRISSAQLNKCSRGQKCAQGYDVGYKSNVVLYRVGSASWIPPAIFKSSCQIDVEYFPFDQQVCEMIFGSRVYGADELRLDYFDNMSNINLNDYIPSGTWDVIDVPVSSIEHEQLFWASKLKFTFPFF